MEDNLGEIRLNLGCGKTRWSKWINVDLEEGDRCCDLRQLDFPTDYADMAAAIHVIEHFYAWEAPELLKEWYRVLKPGGRLILELPCMDKVMAHIHQAVQNNYPISTAFTWFVFWGNPKYEDPLMVHKWGYSKAMIQSALEATGFENVEFSEPRYHFPIRDMRVEAIKPC